MVNVMSKDIVAFSNQKSETIEDEFDFGVRLSECNPDHFRRYFDRFVRYWPKNSESGFYVKRSYHKPWYMPKKKDRRRHLWEEAAIEAAERHLDRDKWRWRKLSQGMYDPPDGPYWLGLYPPKRTTFDLIDFDAEAFRVAWYKQCGQIKPVIIPPVDHFKTMKRIYENFPGRIWCISSETLGIHAYQRYSRPLPMAKLHRATRLQLERIGLGGIEVHPMPGRCLRRPFGEDYTTITPDGVLDCWTDQLDYFEHDGRTPKFHQIAKALMDRVLQQVRSFETSHDIWDSFSGMVGHKCLPGELDRYADRYQQVVDWVNSGCPDVTEPATTISSPDELGLHEEVRFIAESDSIQDQSRRSPR